MNRGNQAHHNADEYLQSLQKQLSGFPPQEQAAILDEIASHIESGQDDPDMGDTQNHRLQKLLAELGSPEQLGNNLHRVHRPKHWIDLLWVLIPLYVVMPLVRRLVIPNDPWSEPDNAFVGLGIRVMIAIGALLLVVSWQRRSVLLQLFWVPESAAYLTSLIVREQRYELWLSTGVTNLLESVLWLMALSGLLIWLARLLKSNREDGSLVIFGLMPLLLTACNMLEVLTLQSLGWAIHQNLWVYWMSWGWQVISVAWLIVFFLSPGRTGRWLALGLQAGFTFLMRGAVWPHPLLVAIWVVFPFLIAMAWAMDQRQQDRLRLRPGG
jgi:hypothetical protein